MSHAPLAGCPQRLPHCPKTSSPRHSTCFGIRLTYATIPLRGCQGMKKLREVLLTQYIGAITIGFVLAQTVTGVISPLVQTTFNSYFPRHTSTRPLDTATPSPRNTLLL